MYLLRKIILNIYPNCFFSLSKKIEMLLATLENDKFISYYELTKRIQNVKS